MTLYKIEARKEDNTKDIVNLYFENEHIATRFFAEVSRSKDYDFFALTSCEAITVREMKQKVVAELLCDYKTSQPTNQLADEILNKIEQVESMGIEKKETICVNSVVFECVHTLETKYFVETFSYAMIKENK